MVDLLIAAWFALSAVAWLEIHFDKFRGLKYGRHR